MWDRLCGPNQCPPPYDQYRVCTQHVWIFLVLPPPPARPLGPAPTSPPPRHPTMHPMPRRLSAAAGASPLPPGHPNMSAASSEAGDVDDSRSEASAISATPSGSLASALGTASSYAGGGAGAYAGGTSMGHSRALGGGGGSGHASSGGGLAAADGAVGGAGWVRCGGVGVPGRPGRTCH